MENQKPLEFHGTAGGFFILTILSIVLIYIPVFGWAFLLNYAASWMADQSLVNGRKIAYKASYGESLGFVFINGLLIIVTLGIYSFWFYPKLYKYIADHVSYADVPVAVAVAAAPESPVPPVTPVSPVFPESTPTSPVPPQSV